ncbi:MAG: type I-E CRISPR-associated protein Cas7/Cse4/CasC [Micrococcales bacterium]|nr:type I-E CRISPR-associated protein Cas7/Cse4/CasC [Micrococcales bacterium]
MPLYVDLHILQTVPPSNLNRDDTGNPKTAIYGGVRRARVSSQAWKRATRAAYASHLDQSDLGVRTKRAVELLAERIRERGEGVTDEQARDRAGQVLAALGIKVESTKSKTAKKSEESGEAITDYGKTQYLIFWSNRQLDRLAELALSTDKPTKREAHAAADNDHGIDVALFGRMVADAADINVDAAVQVAHAISTHPVEIEQDYFTAVDDKNPETETGAGMIGTVDFDSATLYRYATVNVEGLVANLAGDPEATARAIEAFVRAFVTSMPTGKQNTFANRTAPDAVLVTVRTDQPVNLVGAFEEAVTGEGSHVAASTAALVTHMQGVSGFLGEPTETFVARTSDKASAIDALGSTQGLDDLVTRVGAAVRERLGAS